MKVLYSKQFNGMASFSKDTVFPLNSFTEVANIETQNKDEVFHDMQGEFMDNELLRNLQSIILEHGTDHTSMSTGDAVIDMEGKAWLCDFIGWRRITLV